MSNPFLTPVDTFSMTKGLGEAYQQGQKNGEWLRSAQLNREINQQEFDWKKEGRAANQSADAQFDASAPFGSRQPQPHTLAGGLAVSAAPQMGGGTMSGMPMPAAGQIAQGNQQGAMAGQQPYQNPFGAVLGGAKTGMNLLGGLMM